MDAPLAPRKTRKRSVWPLLLLLLFIMIMAAAAGWLLYQVWEERKPNDEHVAPSFNGNPKPIFHQSVMLELPAAGSGDSLKLPLGLVKEHFDPYIYYEEQSQSIIITTADKVVRFRTDQLTAWVNEQPIALTFPVEMIDDQLYIPVQMIQDYYRFAVREHPDTGAVLLLKEGDMLQWAEAAVRGEEQTSVALRTEPTIKAPIMADLEQGKRLMVLEDLQDWLRVQLEEGWIGYVPKREVILAQPEVFRFEEAPQPPIPWKPLGDYINLTWEHVVSRNPDTSKIGQMPGLNVVSPTWFYLADDDGTVGNKASHDYVKWAHERGYQVWGLFSNDFDPDRTKAVLANHDTRMHVIKQILHYAKNYNLQGINIDFENVYLEDKHNMTQFVRELTPYLHEQGLVVSIDVTIRGGSPMWSLFLDREALGKTVDYMMVMTYDEHWASSPVAGSVASLPWTEKGIADIIREDHVPPSKLLLGVPYYTRIWSEERVDGKTKVSSRAVGMSFIENLMREKKLVPVYDEQTGQDYVEYEEDGARKRIWIENETSIKARMEIVKKYELAGIASWRRGFETPNIWTVIQETLEKKP